MKLRLLLLVLTTALGSCGMTEDCTLIGCTGGITIVLEPNLSGPYRVEAYSAPGVARYTYECASATPCSPIFLPDFTPYRFFVHVTRADSTTRYEVLPRYTEFRPNGAQCDPICRNATVRLPSDALVVF